MGGFPEGVRLGWAMSLDRSWWWRRNGKVLKGFLKDLSPTRRQKGAIVGDLALVTGSDLCLCCPLGWAECGRGN